jgi:hypothetical protein
MSGEKPVAMLHSYLADREGRERPDRLSRVNILAAAELYRHGKIDKICITVEPELSEIQSNRLKSLLNSLREEDLVVEPQAVTTREEVETFGNLAKENGWNNLITIGNPVHLPRIRKEIHRVFKDKGIRVEAKSSSEILSQYPRYTKILDDMENWPEQQSLSFQEKVLNTPMVGRLILFVAPIFSQAKISLQSWGFKILEKR